MKMLRLFAILIAAITIVSCSTSGGGDKKDKKDTKAAGNPDSVQIQKDYHSNGNIWHIKEAINLNYGIEGKKARWVLHGTVYEYYQTPKNTLATKTDYVKGKKHGKVYKYYKTGKLYREWDYVNGRKEGIAKKFHQDGYLISEVPYKHDMLGTGTKEFNKEGKELTMPTLKVWTEDTRRKNGTYTVYAKVVNRRGDKLTAEYMNGMLIQSDGKKFSHPNLQKVTKVSDKVAKIQFFESTGFPPFVSIVAKTTTTNRTPVLLNEIVTIK